MQMNDSESSELAYMEEVNFAFPLYILQHLSKRSQCYSKSDWPYLARNHTLTEAISLKILNKNFSLVSGFI